MKRSGWILPLMLASTLIITVISCKTRFATTNSAFKAGHSQGEIERGRILAYSICAGCHYNRQAEKFIGNRIEDVPSIAGEVYSANLTPLENPWPARKIYRCTVAEISFENGRGLRRKIRSVHAIGQIWRKTTWTRSLLSCAQTTRPLLRPTLTIGPTHYTTISARPVANSHAKPFSL